MVRTCLIPSANYYRNRGNIGKTKIVTAKDNVCGQLLTFSFHVNDVNEIKCYIIWNGQMMRFHGDYIRKVLPSLFTESDDNNAFLKSKLVEEIESKFDKYIVDQQLDNFCSQYN